jgi:hypothetical protein
MSLSRAIFNKSKVKYVTDKIKSIFDTGVDSAKRWGKVAAAKAPTGTATSIQQAVKKTIQEQKIANTTYRAAKKIYHVKDTRAGRFAGGLITTPFTWAIRGAVRHPLIAGGILGATHGVGSHLANLAEERTAGMQKPGMSSNHLGTDGLTLSLSRLRHRG